MIYTSRNSFRLLNVWIANFATQSTQVEILLGYLTAVPAAAIAVSTQVEILLGYLTWALKMQIPISTQVEILLGYLTKFATVI